MAHRPQKQVFRPKEDGNKMISLAKSQKESVLSKEEELDIETAKALSISSSVPKQGNISKFILDKKDWPPALKRANLFDTARDPDTYMYMFDELDLCTTERSKGVLRKLIGCLFEGSMSYETFNRVAKDKIKEDIADEKEVEELYALGEKNRLEKEKKLRIQRLVDDEEVPLDKKLSSRTNKEKKAMQEKLIDDLPDYLKPAFSATLDMEEEGGNKEGGAHYDVTIPFYKNRFGISFSYELYELPQSKAIAKMLGIYPTKVVLNTERFTLRFIYCDIPLLDYVTGKSLRQFMPEELYNALMSSGMIQLFAPWPGFDQTDGYTHQP